MWALCGRRPWGEETFRVYKCFSRRSHHPGRGGVGSEERQRADKLEERRPRIAGGGHHGAQKAAGFDVEIVSGFSFNVFCLCNLGVRFSSAVNSSARMCEGSSFKRRSRSSILPIPV